MAIAKEAMALIREFEGMHRKIAADQYAPYKCPASVNTIGIGTTVWPDGRKVSMSDPPITSARAEECLQFDLTKKYAPPVDRGVKVPMHSLMRGALVSFTYNVGTGAFAKSTLLRMVNQRRWSEVPRAFSLYRMGGGRVLAGLERRRKAEALLFVAGVKALQTGGAAAIPVPLVADTPAAPAPVKASIFGRFLSLFQRAA